MTKKRISSKSVSVPPAKAPPMPIGNTNSNPAGISFWSLIAEDFRTHGRNFFSQGFLTLFVHRFGNWRMGVRSKFFRMFLSILYMFLQKLCQVFCGIMLPYIMPVGRRVCLEHFGGMILSARSIGNDVTIRQNTTFGIKSVDDTNARPIIEDHVDIGAGAVIVGNITVGHNTIIGANAVVITDIPPNSVAVGVPAKVIGTR